MIPILILIIGQVTSVKSYIGDWNGKIKDFSSKSGFADLYQLEKSNTILIRLFDGHWKSRPSIIFNCTSNNLPGIIQIHGFTLEQNSNNETKVAGELLISNSEEKSSISGSIHSKIYNFSLNVSQANFIKFIRNIYNFIILFTIIKTLDFYICYKIQTNLSNRIIARSMSLSSIILSSTVDLFYLLWSFELVGTMITLLQFVVLCIISTILLRGKSKIFDRSLKSQSLSRRRHGFSTYMFISTLYISTLNSLYYVNVIASNMVFIPHIVKNSGKLSISKYYVSILMINQMIITLAIILWEDNFLLWEPNYFLSAAVVVVVIAQLIYLFYYSRDVRPEAEGLHLQGELDSNLGYEEIVIFNDTSSLEPSSTCTICLCEMGRPSVVRTPCEHWFHLSCIQGWLRISSVCPVCRSEVDELYRRV